ncbi:hypothetical protein IC006_0763 [Sulfuracidifex tepidarius]|uniref:Uncharacterized protein n=1 Tax=Sulfuracidifex tepidarius TaxID=1294262 RepID=A0A510DTH9_9CREN|nr:hypothetical protein IC006_0763 [Sulfuracidifex tepidarius]
MGKRHTHTAESYNSYSSPTCPDWLGTEAVNRSRRTQATA